MAGDPITRVFRELALGQKGHELAELRLAGEQEEQAASHLKHAIDTLDPEADAVETIECALQGSTTAFIRPPSALRRPPAARPVPRRRVPPVHSPGTTLPSR